MVDEVKEYRDHLYRAVEDMKAEELWKNRAFSSPTSLQALSTWNMHFSLFHYLNVPRITTTLLLDNFSFRLPNEMSKKLRQLGNMDELDLDDGLLVIEMFDQAFRKWPIQALDLDDPQTIAEDNVGARIAFRNWVFNPRNISKNFELTGNIDLDPRLSISKHGVKIILSIDPSWIVSNTALSDLVRARTAPLSGFGVIKLVEEELVIVTPLYFGLLDPTVSDHFP